MAKTISEELMALLDADGQAKLREAFNKNPGLLARDVKAKELMDVYDGVIGDESIMTTIAAHTPTVPSAASTSASAQTPTATTATTTSSNTELAAILAKLTTLESSIDTKLDAKLKNFVTADKLPEYRTELLTLAIKSADDYASVREAHREEFKKPLDRAAFEKFVADQKAAGVSYPSMKAAHDTFVTEERTTAAAAAEKKRIDDGIAAGMQQLRSGALVAGQTQSTAMSASQQVIAKAKAGATGTGAESAALRAARAMEELDRNRASV